MRSDSYTPRHGAARHARKRTGLSAVRRPVVGGAIAVAMLGSVGATVAIGDPSHDTGGTATTLTSPEQSASPAADSETVDTARLAESRRATNVSRSASREQDRLSAAAAKKKAEEKARAEEKAKPISERDFTDAEIKIIQRDPQPYAKQLLGEYGWGEGEWSCLISLWNGESNWTWDATNSSSGAYGIPQSLPADKMATAGPDWKTNPVTQMIWGMDYIKASYGSPCQAKAFWDSNNPHWY